MDRWYDVRAGEYMRPEFERLLSTLKTVEQQLTRYVDVRVANDDNSDKRQPFFFLDDERSRVRGAVWMVEKLLKQTRFVDPDYMHEMDRMEAEQND